MLGEVLCTRKQEKNHHNRTMSRGLWQVYNKNMWFLLIVEIFIHQLLILMADYTPGVEVEQLITKDNVVMEILKIMKTLNRSRLWPTKELFKLQLEVSILQLFVTIMNYMLGVAAHMENVGQGNSSLQISQSFADSQKSMCLIKR